MLRIEAGFHSDQGDRENNEDCAAVLAAGCAVAVADGMGGHGGGEVASALAVETVRRAVAGGLLEKLTGEEIGRRLLKELFAEANQQILEAGRKTLNLRGMGTTLTLALIRGERLFFAHVGDSRLYLCQAGRWAQLTQDHTQAQELVDRGWISPAEATRSKYRHVLTRCLGMPRTVEPHLGALEVHSGARLLLCSDGLYNELGPERLTELMAADRPPKELAESLVAAAGDHGREGLDNITALVVSVK